MKPGFPRFASLSMLFVLLLMTVPAHAYANSLLDSSSARSDKRSVLQQVTDTPIVTIAPTDTLHHSRFSALKLQSKTIEQSQKMFKTDRISRSS
jgi:hypothetical protein